MPARKLDPKLEATGREVRIATTASPDCQTANLDFDALDVRSSHYDFPSRNCSIERVEREADRTRKVDEGGGGREEGE